MRTFWRDQGTRHEGYLEETRRVVMRGIWREPRGQGTRHEGNLEGTRGLGMMDFWKDQGTRHNGDLEVLSSLY